MARTTSRADRKKRRPARTSRRNFPTGAAIIPRYTAEELAVSRKRLDDIAEAYRIASKASNTKRAYDVGLRSWRRYCDEQKEIAFPATPEAIARWLSWLAHDEGRSVATIEVYLAALAALHRHTGATETPTRSFVVTETMGGIRNDHGVRPRKKAPLTWEALLPILPPADATDLGSIRDRALLLLGFTLAARRSELVGLRAGDVRFERQGMRVLIRRSKTDQTGKGREVGIARQDNETLCPVRALRRWLRASGIERGPIFRSLRPDGGLRPRGLTPEYVARMIRRRTAAAGLEGDFSGHSLRRGFATSAYAAGVPEIAIQRRTGHRSLLVLREYADEAGAYEEEPLTEIAASTRKRKKRPKSGR